MGIWKKLFGRDKGEEAPPAPPAPAAPPTGPPAPPSGGEKRGLFGKLFGRGKKKAEEAPKPPEAPPAPPAPPTGPPAPPVPPEGPEEGPEEAAEAEEAEEEEREFPASLYVSASGGWKISRTWWEGTMHGALNGADVRVFILAMEAERGPDYETAIPLVADAYGIDSGLLDVSASRVDHVGY